METATANRDQENVEKEAAFQPPNTPETLKRVSWAPLPCEEGSLHLGSH
jgi:hypothetical protein